METKQIHLFDDRYTFVSDSREVCSILHSLGQVKTNSNDPIFFTRKSWIDCQWRALFVLVGDGEYLEVWGITCEIPYLCLYAERITQKQTRAWHAWIVSEGLQGGYLPSSVYYLTSKKAALSYAAELARELRDSEYDVIGSAESGYEYKLTEQDDYYFQITLESESFPTKQARDSFIRDNQDC